MVENTKIPMGDIRIEIMGGTHKSVINSFRSYEQELTDFLIEDSLDNQKKKISITYLWSLKGTNELLGYITLLADKISLDTSLKEEFRIKGILYKSLPAVKIGRICIDDRYLKRGIGALMIQFAIFQAKKVGEKVGCRFITLDAKRNSDPSKDSFHFYKKMGFDVLKGREKGTTPMYKDLVKIMENI